MNSLLGSNILEEPSLDPESKLLLLGTVTVRFVRLKKATFARIRPLQRYFHVDVVLCSIQVANQKFLLIVATLQQKPLPSGVG